nr:PREDICTED: lipid droplet-associated hydrolase isoform X3 [Lepisosteus oculatus]
MFCSSLVRKTNTSIFWKTGTAKNCQQRKAPIMGSPSRKEKSERHKECIYCCRAATEVLKFGPRELKPTKKSENTPEVLFLVIPGNPGIVGYYETFIQTLYNKLGQKYPVWAVSQAGHCVPPDNMDMIEDTDTMVIKDVFGLNGQIEHKLAFLKQHVPRDVKLVLIGHSIGCYIILEMMKRDPGLRVLKSVLLFPTIERMAHSPQANAMYMGSQEMVQVLDRDNSTIKQHLDKLIFYYGANDHWCPVQYYEDIRKDFPEGNIQLCEKGIRHAFVLDASKDVASMITEWIRTDLENL